MRQADDKCNEEIHAEPQNEKIIRTIEEILVSLAPKRIKAYRMSRVEVPYASSAVLVDTRSRSSPRRYRNRRRYDPMNIVTQSQKTLQDHISMRSIRVLVREEGTATSCR
jgi:hypothetical protein